VAQLASSIDEEIEKRERQGGVLTSQLVVGDETAHAMIDVRPMLPSRF
jgi:hypothetical protein